MFYLSSYWYDSLMHKINKIADKLIKDKHGNVVITQLPNLALLSFFLFSILGLIFRNGNISYAFKALSFGSIFTWSWMEIFSGVNYFRRILGLIVMIGSIGSFIAYTRIATHR